VHQDVVTLPDVLKLIVEVLPENELLADVPRLIARGAEIIPSVLERELHT
jgi:hypothetical protein